MQRYIHIEGDIILEDTKLNHDEVYDKFIEWIESQGLLFCGTTMNRTEQENWNDIIDTYKEEYLNDNVSVNKIREETGIDIIIIRKRVKKWLNEE
jgi:hypothetical protein